MTDEDAQPEAEPRHSRLSALFGSKPSGAVSDPELKARMRTLDPLERRWGFVGAAIPLLVAAVFIPSLLHNTTQVNTTTPTKSGVCPTDYTHHGTQCIQRIVNHPSDFVLRFSLLVVLGLLLLFAVWASKRTLVIFTSFLTGLAAGTLGLLLIAYGAWLLLRSWRLQRYGTTNSKEVRQIAIERTEAKREAKKAGPVTPLATGKAPPPPSKRYTPKAKPRKK